MQNIYDTKRFWGLWEYCEYLVIEIFYETTWKWIVYFKYINLWAFDVVLPLCHDIGDYPVYVTTRLCDDPICVSTRLCDYLVYVSTRLCGDPICVTTRLCGDLVMWPWVRFLVLKWYWIFLWLIVNNM